MRSNGSRKIWLKQIIRLSHVLYTSSEYLISASFITHVSLKFSYLARKATRLPVASKHSSVRCVRQFPFTHSKGALSSVRRSYEGKFEIRQWKYHHWLSDRQFRTNVVNKFSLDHSQSLQAGTPQTFYTKPKNVVCLIKWNGCNSHFGLFLCSLTIFLISDISESIIGFLDHAYWERIT